MRALTAAAPAAGVGGAEGEPGLVPQLPQQVEGPRVARGGSSGFFLVHSEDGSVGHGQLPLGYDRLHHAYKTWLRNSSGLGSPERSSPEKVLG